ncbi:hypothetical protein OTC26_017225 [Streptomyces tirandamycinicus]|uniref:hypothetical protein n=1 Tax=Streptomyces tirandamycinicus TaxID=2174846 RepID=UPI0022715F4C|nr:hypothetical protein [Streptomyces tirandamycinicus]MCY0981920.1 hypothetical protein [Streptomyces tirandamycinicus]
MPTPHGSRGGMAFSADELRVLRRALAIALNPDQSRRSGRGEAPGSPAAQEYLRLAQSVDEAVREAGRLRVFLLADLARYRDALPGSASGYLELLQEALAAGHELAPEDLAALRSLHRAPRRSALPERSRGVAEESVPARQGAREPAAAPSRVRLHALPGGRASAGDKQEPRPATPKPARPAPRPDRPIPTPGEVFPPRRRPAPPPEKRAAG